MVHWCRTGKHSEGYEPLPDKPRPGAWAVNIKKKQEEYGAEAEKALMEIYNALYKLQDCIPPVRSICLQLRSAIQHVLS